MMASWDIGLGGWLWMIIWIAALLAMIWLIVGRSREDDSSQDALEILRARFARGEIGPDEFERARSLLVRESESRP